MTVIQDTRPCNIRALSTFVTGTALPSQVYKRSQKCLVTQRGTDGPLFFDVGGGGGWGVGGVVINLQKESCTAKIA